MIFTNMGFTEKISIFNVKKLLKKN